MTKKLTNDELQRIRSDWKIENPELAVNEQITINELLDVVEDLLYKLEIADIALDEIEDMCNDPHDVKTAEEALIKIRQ